MDSLEKKDHDNLNEEIENSYYSVVALGVWIAERTGLDVKIPEQRIAKDPKARRLYLDDGDLFIEKKRVEVKHLNTEWTSKEDYPYPDFMVCNMDAFDRAKNRNEIPTCFIYINSDFTHLAILIPENYKKWKKRRGVKDSRRSYKENKYMTKKDEVLWF